MNGIKFKANKPFIVIASLTIIVLIGIAATAPPVNKNAFKNLKVLPQDISKEKLHNIMNEFNESLGVKCTYCHAPKDSLGHMDFASDSNNSKEDARYMMKMTMQINKDYLKVNQPMIGDSSMVITCYTCHHGTPFPDRKMEVFAEPKNKSNLTDTTNGKH